MEGVVGAVLVECSVGVVCTSAVDVSAMVNCVVVVVVVAEICS